MTQPPTPPTRRQFALLILILAVAAFVRFYRIGTPSLWSDELWSIEMAMGHGSVHDAFPDGVVRFDQPIPTNLAAAAPWWDIWTHVQVITHPPLYYIILRWWITLFGNSPAATRSLSALFSLAAVAIFFDVCRLLHGPRAALIASSILALAIGQIDIAQESRSYALLILQEIAACDVIARIILFGATRRRLALLIFLLAAMFLTHYLCVGVLAALAIVAILRLRGRDGRLTFTAFAVAAVLILALWGYGFVNQLRTIPFSDPTYFHEIFPHHFASSIRAIVRLPLQYLVGEDLGLRLPFWAHILAALTVAILIFRAIWHRDLLLWRILLIFTIVFIAAIDLTRDSTLLQYSRYTILASPAIFALLATIDWPKKSYLFSLAVVASLAILALLRIAQPIPPRQDFRQLAEIIDSHATPDELLVFYNQSDWLSPGMWYTGYKYYSPNSAHPWLTLRHPPDPQLLRQLQSRQTLWLIGRTPEIFGPIILPGWRPVSVWHTSAGGACLMRNAAQSGSVP
jgi:uncharacterized membrane protein